MPAPLSASLGFSHALEMLVAVIIGMGFGFTLERAGFGSAANLAAQFYGRDMRVLRVMFTAIATACIGLYGLDLVGVLPLSSVGILDTRLGGQIAGGLLLGAGFVVGGYCPGTSIVAAVAGKIDAVLFMGGMILGSVAYALAAPVLDPLAEAGATGRVLVHEWLGISSGVAVLLVALVAVSAFALAGRIEAAVRARMDARGDATGATAEAARRAAPWIARRPGAAALIAAASACAVVSLARGYSARAEQVPDLSPRPGEHALDVWKVAAALVDSGGAAAVIDVRSGEAFARYHVPGAESLPGAAPGEIAARARGRPLVVVCAADDPHGERLAAAARAAAPGAPVFFLAGGARAFYVALELPVPLFTDAPAPWGYAEAVDRVRAFLRDPDPAAREDALQSVRRLAAMRYAPAGLAAEPGAEARVPRARREIAGGCG